MFKKSIYNSMLWIFGLWILLVFSLNSASERIEHAGHADLSYLDHPFASIYQPYLEEFADKGHPGVGALIRTLEEGTWFGSAGYARIEDRTPIRPNHLFCTLSSAKAYTAAAILMLWEEGLIDLDACIDQYLPNDICDQIANGHSATVRHLMTHTSGIPDSDEKRDIIEIYNDPLSWSWLDDLEGIYGKPALFPAGTNLEYRSSNFILLAVIIDELTGSHSQFFSTRIFQPLGLQDTYYKYEPGLPCPPDQVNIYFDRYGDGKLENITDVLCVYYHNVHTGSSGIMATLADCANFMEALMDGWIVGPDALAIMTSPSFPGFEWRGMGIGVIDWLDSEGNAHRFYEMAGSGMEGLAQTRYFPMDGITISIATNVGSTNRPDAHENFYALLDDLTYAVFNLRTGQTASRKANIKKRTPGKIIIR